jgi:hypothetical protein
VRRGSFGSPMQIPYRRIRRSRVGEQATFRHGQ